MKIKIFKKLIAFLCAAAISMSAISSVGAIEYKGNNPLQYRRYVSTINNLINNSLTKLKEIKNYYIKKEKAELASLATSISDNLNRLNKKTVYDSNFLTGALQDTMFNIADKIKTMETQVKNNANCEKDLKDAKTAVEALINMMGDPKKSHKEEIKINNNNIKIDNINNNKKLKKRLSQKNIFHKNNKEINFNNENNNKNNNNNFIINININNNKNKEIKKGRKLNRNISCDKDNNFNNFININNNKNNNFNNIKINNFNNENNIKINNFNNIKINNFNNKNNNFNNIKINNFNNKNNNFNNINPVIKPVINPVINPLINPQLIGAIETDSDSDDEDDIKNPILKIYEEGKRENELYPELANDRTFQMTRDIRQRVIHLHRSEMLESPQSHNFTVSKIFNYVWCDWRTQKDIKTKFIKDKLEKGEIPLISDLVYFKEGDKSENKFNSNPAFNIETINKMKKDMGLKKLIGNEKTFEEISNKLSILIAEKGQELTKKQQEQFGTREKFIEHMNQLNTAINPGVQTGFKTKDGKSHGNCWLYSVMAIQNYFAIHNSNSQVFKRQIIKNTDEDDLKKTNTPDQLTTAEKFVDESLNKSASSNDKIDVKYGQNDSVTQRLLNKMNIYSLEFKMPNYGEGFDHDELMHLSLKTQTWLLLEHFLNSDTPVLWKTYGRKMGHQTAIMGINTFDKDVMLGDIENRVAFPGSLVTFEHFSPDNGITCYNTIYPYSTNKLKNSFYRLHLDASSLIFTFVNNRPILTTTESCTLKGLEERVLPIIKK